jgi:hypothetical protein
VSVILGCVPWHWKQCLSDGQQHGQYERFHRAESLTQTLHYKGLTSEQMETTTPNRLLKNYS